MLTPSKILDAGLKRASANISNPIVDNPDIFARIDFVCHSSNRACARLLLAASLAKIHKPEVDIRKPYTEIEGSDTYSGRTYDEKYITDFVREHDLPCNPTTAFLTPALRNINFALTPDLAIEGRPRKLYQETLQLLNDVHQDKLSAEDLLAEIIRCLLILRNEKRQRLQILSSGLAQACQDSMPLSSEGIVKLIQQHFDCPRSSRLPVLAVVAAYKAAEQHLGERVLPLKSHTAADEQTGALGDIEITLIDDDDVVTSYEMKARQVTQADINRALDKLSGNTRIDNYIFITTETIDKDVQIYARSLYEETGGIEFVILDCIDFLRHFLHLFHRLRVQFLDNYQKLVIEEPESSVRQELKEALLVLRQAAESRE
jgi:hypothetical protein